METENLSLVEAWRALLDGKCVQNENWDYQRSVQEGVLHYWRTASNDWREEDDHSTVFYPDEYSIVEDPSIPKPKSLTAEEAVDLLDRDKKIAVNNCAVSSTVLELCSHFEQQQRFHELISFTCYLDLAERKGWPITLAE